MTHITIERALLGQVLDTLWVLNVRNALHHGTNHDTVTISREALAICEQALAQPAPVQQVAATITITRRGAVNIIDNHFEDCVRDWPDGEYKLVLATPPAAQPAPVQEPVAWRYDLKRNGSFAGVSREYSPVKLSIGENWTPLYTTPPAKQRQWVDLPDEEIKILWVQYRAALPRYLCFAKELLQRSKEKNT